MSYKKHKYRSIYQPTVQRRLKIRHHQTGCDWGDDDVVAARRTHSHCHSHRAAHYLAVVKRVPPDDDGVSWQLSRRRQHHRRIVDSSTNPSSNRAQSGASRD